MENIPISFEYNGKTFQGYFHQVSGTGDSGQWYLMDSRNFYWGMIHINSMIKDWVFYESGGRKELDGLSQFFGNYLIAWYE